MKTTETQRRAPRVLRVAQEPLTRVNTFVNIPVGTAAASWNFLKNESQLSWWRRPPSVYTSHFWQYLQCFDEVTQRQRIYNLFRGTKQQILHAYIQVVNKTLNIIHYYSFSSLQLRHSKKKRKRKSKPSNMCFSSASSLIYGRRRTRYTFSRPISYLMNIVQEIQRLSV